MSGYSHKQMSEGLDALGCVADVGHLIVLRVIQAHGDEGEPMVVLRDKSGDVTVAISFIFTYAVK